MSFATRERELLAHELIQLGPDAPTLCEGWTTHDLAVHLYIRENRPHKAAGMFVSLLAGALEAETKKQLQRPYADVVQGFAAGPPKLIAPFDSAINSVEIFVHHEDVRRGDGIARPREFSRAVNDNFMNQAKRFARFFLPKLPVPVILTPPDLPPVTVGGKLGVSEKGDGVVRVTGQPGELLLWVTGRTVVEVDIEGDSQYVQELNVKA